MIGKLNSNPTTQRGMSTLFMATILSVVISLMSVYAAQVSVMEQKISANHYRGKQAYEAAQAGLDIALEGIDAWNLAGGQNVDLTHMDLLSCGNLENFDTCQLNIAPKAGKFQVTLTGADNDLLRLDAYGFPNDDTDSDISRAQHIVANLKRTSLIGYAPPAPIVAKGTVNINNAGTTVTHNSGDPLAAVWSGGTTTVTSGTIDVGTDALGGIYANLGDMTLFDDPDPVKANNNFFNNFFSQDKTRMKNQANGKVISCQTGCTEADLKDNNGDPLTGIIWIDSRDTHDTTDTSDDTFGTLNFDNLTLGTPENPVILIVDGNINLGSAAAAINGMVYTTQDFIQTGGGGGTINGSLISEKSINITDPLTLNYVPTTISNLQQKATMYTRIIGSWTDVGTL